MKEKNDTNHPSDTENQTLQDRLNETIGVLTRREVEARILGPIIEALGNEFGRDRVVAVLRDTIVKIAEAQGTLAAELMGGNSLREFYDSLKFWTKDDAMEIDLIEQTDEIFSFNVTRCGYAELYEKLGILELGTTLSCARDFALIRGFNKDITLKRSQTIMEGAPHCDFRYKLEKKKD
ncbi:MAG: L-2-amino-thiazoline-4-carboxylic acid hydrolase [Desulfobacterales bacterium]|jgi:hypothetical protein